MATSAAIATAANEEMATAVRGETAGPQAAIVVVCRETSAREILTLELSKRYGADYQIAVCHRPAEVGARMRDLAAAGLPVALVIGGVGAQDPDGVEVLAAVRQIDPAALRVAAVRWGDWESVRSIFVLELRDLLTRHRVPVGFYDAASEHGRQLLHELGRQLLHELGLQSPELPVVEILFGLEQTTLVNPSNPQIADAFGIMTPMSAEEIFDVAIVGAGPAGLAAAVYASSEGLRTVVVEHEAVGGQAGTSSMIRNYPGFSQGISGSRLAQETWQQAWTLLVHAPGGGPVERG